MKNKAEAGSEKEYPEKLGGLGVTCLVCSFR